MPAEHLNPRGAQVVAREKPTDQERRRWDFQRYVRRPPSGGEMRLSGRPRYDRAGVERVRGFCTPDESLLGQPDPRLVGRGRQVRGQGGGEPSCEP